MTHILIAPGAFKHSLTAAQAGAAIARGLHQSGIHLPLVQMPIADGGNGTLDAFLAQGGERIEVEVTDPLLRPVRAAYGRLADGTAVIEMALASGIELLHAAERDPFRATTYGTGQLMQHALEHGARRFIIGMGGSATNDGGAGALQALGVYFADTSGKNIAPGNAALGNIVSLHTSQLDPRWQTCDLLFATDVDNPALGEHGATAVFAPQKGASSRDLPRLEANLTHYFQQIRHWRGMDVTTLAGGGAAGAMAAGLMAFLGGRIASGIELLLAHNHFDDHLQQAALVITGEGQLDSQTLHGKGPLGIAQRARACGVPTLALVGSLNTEDEGLHEAGFQAVLPIMDKPMPLETALERAEELLERAALRLGYILQIRLKEEQAR